ncbi:MAG: STAS domain-containing protein, partial [Leptospiraceae bacterium]|nr:STAS domain-containing protein [Leptospiraceae bacterium]
PVFQQAVAEALYRKRVILDFDAVDFVDSTGFSVILETMRTIQSNGGAMRVVAAAAKIRNLFRALFGEHLPVHTTRTDAIESF